MNQISRESPKKFTARRYIVDSLAQEILKTPDDKDRQIASEHQLCRRFSVSRVTIRLALYDLEHRGLIYRRHGKGTFAHGRLSRPYRSLGILIKSPDALKQAPIVEIIRGAHAALAPFRMPLLLISTSPLEWRAENTHQLGGVIALPELITAEEMAVFKNLDLPLLCIEGSLLCSVENDFFNLGQRAAEALNLAAATGEVSINLAAPSPAPDSNT